MHVSKVRRKLGDSDESGDHIKTIRGVGYMFARPGAKARNEKPLPKDFSIVLGGAGAFF